MKIYTLILILILLSCKKQEGTGMKEIKVIISPDSLNVKTIQKTTKNHTLTTFLENPINLKEYKNKKTLVTTSVANGLAYPLHPNRKDSVFYKYYYVNATTLKKYANILVFKYGKGKHNYDDDSEILIALNIFDTDTDLKDANLVGLTKTAIESKFGTGYRTVLGKMIYSHKNKILLLTFNNSKIISYRFIKLNTEYIDDDLIQKIINTENQ